ncbi:PQQ-binding-like beta-propeller repeat protein [Bacteroides sp. UBA939]|uniref:outer membrane protein assembly factor BamB family protein n=1 Tax=Bacteroides sp. UBA939 TaxID=1946092 RepID=UPI0025C3FA14|nr:PQQ-binding-like beta-propeller repeat protein [Bacteroides sp. UBA939]
MKNKILLCVCSVFAFITVSAQGQENWAQFRGLNGQGISKAKDTPVRWSTEENIAWKTDIPGEAWSSPIVWNDHIFVTTATEDGKNCHVIAIDRITGKILWNKIVFTQQPSQHRHEMNSYATPTPATDGKTVFAVFSGGGFAALDFEGNIRWTNNELDFYSHHGMGTSPILYGDLLLLAVNHSNREEPKSLGFQELWDKSYLLALDKNTGKERWRGTRGMTRIAHSTPAVMQVNGKDQIISSAGDVIQGFNPADGKLIWTVTSVGEPCVPSIVIGDGLIYASHTNRAPIMAVRPDGQGDCTTTHIAWKQEGYTPMMSSFLYVKPYLYTCPDNRVCCLDASTGEFLWQIRLRGGQLNPSPLYADGKIYVLSERGTTTVLKPSADPKEPAEILATNELNALTRASIAVAGKQLIIRTANHLWCIGK